MANDNIVDGWHETEADRRVRISAQVRQWCELGRIDTVDRPLSDDAAVLIAAGHLDESTRTVLLNRRAEGRTIPTVGGFGALRLVFDEYRRVQEKAVQLRPGPVQMIYNYRLGELLRRLQAARSTVVTSPTHYATGIRAIRRDRRAGVHLDLEQRDALFAALRATPAPARATSMIQVRGVAVEAAERLAQQTRNARLADAGRRAADALAGSPGGDGQSFTDRHDALLFLAGTLFDRIDSSRVWHSDHFLVQRAQLDLADELLQIAVDTVALRGIGIELATAARAARSDSARAQIAARERALAPVWNQLVERVSALARIGDLLGKAEEQLQSIAAVNHTLSLDSRIDELLARSGNRELSAANTHFVGDQFADVDEFMMTYQSVLGADIAALTARGTA
ncbi:hypothetical protein ACHIPZ_16060 [Antrihabitans sp. NCIMB 15449]|uniref:Uncharacterized protein n=1 Tax=Antrihabitans spumae TaxID=3373370 RepID=A0ABW7JRU4_9NOCA